MARRMLTEANYNNVAELLVGGQWIAVASEITAASESLKFREAGPRDGTPEVWIEVSEAAIQAIRYKHQPR